MDELFDAEPPALDTDSQRISASRRLQILASLRQEREQRRAMASQGQRYIIDHTDLTPVQAPSANLRSETIAKLLSERRGAEKSESQRWNSGSEEDFGSPAAQVESPMEIPNDGETWNIEPAENPGLVESPHQAEMQPDYRQLANIYDSYKHVPDTPVRPTQRVKPAARTSSAPPARRKTKDDLRKEAEERLRAECTFKPKITQMPKGKEYGYGSKTTAEDKFDRLSRPRTDIIQKREKQKRENEEKMLAECRFKPTINQSARSSVVDVSERLYREADNRVAEREQLKRMIEEEQISLYAFHPQVQSSTSVLVGRLAERPPIYKRVGEVQREKQETLQRLRISAEKNDPDLTFKPEINPRSARLAEQKSLAAGEAHLTISEKLAKDAQDKVLRQMQRAEMQEQSDIVRYSFEPHLRANLIVE